METMSCIPFIGSYFSQNKMIDYCLKRTSIPALRIELIKAKNNYNLSDTVSNVTASALIIYAISVSFFSIGLGSALLVGQLFVTGLSIYQFYSDKKVLPKLQTSQP